MTIVLVIVLVSFIPRWNPPARRRPVSPALLQADCAFSALPPSRLPNLPATFAVLWYPRVLVLVYYTCSSPVSPGALVPAIVLVLVLGREPHLQYFAALWCP